jgi:hypothetical protein
LSPTLTSGLSSKAPYLGHVFSISAHGHATFTASFASLFWSKFMCVPALVRDLASLAGNLTLFFSIHSGKSS